MYTFGLMDIEICLLHNNVTGPEKTRIIYTKYMYLYYGLFCMYYIKSETFIEFHIHFCISDGVFIAMLVKFTMFI